MARSNGAAGEPLLTRFLILETSDLTRFDVRGSVLARGADEARRRYFATLPVDQGGSFVAVSENNFKAHQRTPSTKVTVKVEEVKIPASRIAEGEGATEEPVSGPAVDEQVVGPPDVADAAGVLSAPQEALV